VDLNSMMAHSIEWYEKPGKLSKVSGKETATRDLALDFISIEV
jgi:hypothetical protein